MIKNYFKIAWRNLWRNKLYSAITIAGLSLAMAGAILLLIWIQNAMSIDQFHVKSNSLYKVFKNTTVNGYIQTSGATPSALAPGLTAFPEIKNTTRLLETSGKVAIGDKVIMVKGNIVDPAFLLMFSFPLEKGNSKVAFNSDHAILITASLADKLFPGANAVGQIVSLDTMSLVVTGVLKDLPNNTQFSFEYLLPWKYAGTTGTESWSSGEVTTFVELDPATNEVVVNKKVGDIINRYTGDELHTQVFLYPFSKTWLYGNFNNGAPSGGGITIVRLLFGIVFLLLLIGCINFMNLNTARGEQRAKEVGVRKIAGAGKRNLIFQFLSESILLAFIAGIIALCIAQSLLPSFNNLTEKHLSITFESISFWLAATAFILFTGLLAGSYPAFYLSSFKALNVIKKTINIKYAMLTPRKVLVVIQFVVSNVMINYSYVLITQTNFMMQRDTGFAKDKLLFCPMTNELQKNYEAVKQALIKTGKVDAVNKQSGLITRAVAETNNLHFNGAKLDYPFQLVTANADFVKTNGLQLIAGRDIDLSTFPTDTSSCIINETAVKALGVDNAVGKRLIENNTACTVVGVVKDFVNDYPGQPVKPLMVKGSSSDAFINIRLNSNVATTDVASLNEVLKKYNLGYITELLFASDDYARRFKGAAVSITLATGFSCVAIFISCLGLFGLGIFIVSTRTKEIGIRKVLGASVGTITWLLNRDFAKLLLIAVLIASPIAWLLMKATVQNFSYRINIEWWMLALTGILSIVIGLVTVSFRSITAAVVKPVESLRVE